MRWRSRKPHARLRRRADTWSAPRTRRRRRGSPSLRGPRSPPSPRRSPCRGQAAMGVASGRSGLHVRKLRASLGPTSPRGGLGRTRVAPPSPGAVLTPDRRMAETGDRLVLKPGRLKWLALLVASAVFAFAGVLIFLTSSRPAGVLILVFFGLGAPVSLVELFSGRV